MGASAMEKPASRSWLLVCVLAVVVLSAYANHFQNDFHFDDSHTVTDNVFIRYWSSIPRFFVDPNLFSAMPDHATWRPLVSTSLVIDYKLGSGSRFWFHFSTFLWFLVQLTVMFLLFRRIMDWAAPHPANTAAALFATALYGVHPVNAETVNYIIQRGDLYCTLGVVASVAWFAADKPRRKYGLYLLPAAAAVLSKAPALVFPFLLLAYAWLFETDRKWIPALRATWPAFAAAGLLALLTAKMTPAAYNPGAISASQYRVTQPWVALYYFRSFFLPTGLTADTDMGYVAGSSPEAIAGFLFLTGLVALVVRTSRVRRLRPVAFGIIWFLIALAPTSLMALAEVENDHRMFFPFVGLVLAVVWTVRLLVPERLPVARWATVMFVILAAAALGTRERNAVWHTEESLWRDVTVKSPKNGRGLMNYGLIFLGRGDYQTALDYFQRALPLTPNYSSLEINLGIALGGLHRDQEAGQHFQRAIQLAPGDADPYFFTARWLAGAGRVAESVPLLERAVAINRLSFRSRDLLMEGYAWLGNWQKLSPLATETLQLSPGDDIARRLLEHPVVRAGIGQIPTVPPKPEAADPEIRSNLDEALREFQSGKYTGSIAAARKVLEKHPNSAEAYNLLAASYNSMQRWDEAIQAGLQAVNLKPDFQLARNNLMWSLAQKTKKKQ
jgi:Flp pilus assembly protein TadD